MPVPTAVATTLYGAAYGFLPIGWIILNAVFLYNLTVHTGQFEIVKVVGRPAVERPPDPGAARRLFVWRVHRGRVRLRNAGGDLLGASHRARIHSALRRGAVAHRQHRACRVRCDRHTDSHARGRHRHPGSDAWRDGRPSIAVRVADRSGLARGDDERLARLRGVWPAVLVCGGTFATVQFFWSNFVGARTRRHRRRPRVDRRARAVHARVAAARGVGVSE